jgi:Zn finger protein HypA/HybF involved in hydrogenase expression
MTTIERDGQHLDGNVAGGVLGQIFAVEMTMAQLTCASCSQRWQLGGALAYTTAMGTILRCPGCGEALIRIAHGPGRLWMDISGVQLLELRVPE